MDINKMDIKQLAQGLRAKDFTAVELCGHFLSEIEAKEPEINALITVTSKVALDEASSCDKALAEGQELPILAGIPFALKDNILTKGILTSGGSKTLANFIPPYDATVRTKLKEQKTVLLGKTNLDEFAMGSTTESSFYGPTKNPLDTSRAPGGSSGGSAAAVAAGEVPFALGSDTGGSICQPAAYCGIVGMRPSYSLVSRYGVIAMTSSMDQVGPLTRTVQDNALVLQAIAGHDPQDSVSHNHPLPDFSARLGRGVEGLKIGLPLDHLETKVRPEIKNAILKVVANLESQGAKIVTLRTGNLEAALPAYYLLTSAEVSSNLGRFDGIHYGYRSKNYETLEDIYYNSRSEGLGKEAKRRIMLGTFALSSSFYDAFYVKAQKVRTYIAREMTKALEQADLILAPVTADIAPKLGTTKSPVERYKESFSVVLAPLAGLPALSLPSGYRVEGMPIGLQLIGSSFSEQLLYQAGEAVMALNSEEKGS